jgi:hypothetical protein
MDAIDELVARSVDCPKLRAFHKAHRLHPETFDFLVAEIQLRLESGFPAFSYHCLAEYARWKIEKEEGPTTTFFLNDNDVPFYGRALIVLHPEFNGHCEFRKSEADEIFGTRIEPIPEKRPKNYARRLQWADGRAIEDGWRPTIPHVVGAVRRKRDIHHGR